MGWRFRKRIRLFSGLRLNLSKSGVSASVGKPGATVNVNTHGTRATVGLPGTGISYQFRRRIGGWLVIFALLAIWYMI